MSKRRNKVRTKNPSTKKEHLVARLKQSWRSLRVVEKWSVATLLGVVLWALLQTAWTYPSAFFPRFADEGIYAAEAFSPASVFNDYNPSEIRYGSAKLGYGLPLAASRAMFGPDGPMYLSTFFWLCAIVIIAIISFYRFGLLPSVVAVSLVSFSPMVGKYLAEVGPTTEVMIGFLVLWAACTRRRFWLSGLAIGLVAFIDFKWALPAGLAYVAVELLVHSGYPLKERVIRVALAGVVALSLIGFIVLLHPPYGEYLYEYVSSHAGLVDIQPSPIFGYYIYLFGALPAVLGAVVALTIPAWRERFRNIGARARRSFWDALILAVVPILFHSLFGIHKGLRFFAVLLPLLLIPIAVVIATLIRTAADTMSRWSGKVRTAGLLLISVAAAGLVHGGSDGPAHHLTLHSGYQNAIEKMTALGFPPQSGNISSYNWPAVWYGWPSRYVRQPFAYLGLSETDRWIALESVPDRATVEYRLLLRDQQTDPDSVWASQRASLTAVADSLFTVPSDFYASDYYLAELVPKGVNVLRRWREMAATSDNALTIYQIDDADKGTSLMPLTEGTIDFDSTTAR